MRKGLSGLLLVLGACTVREFDDAPAQGPEQPAMPDANAPQAPNETLGADAPTSAAIDAAPVAMDAAPTSARGAADALDATTALDARMPEAAAPVIDAGEVIILSDLALCNAPSGSFRRAAWGYDAEHGLCVSAIWIIDGAATRYCDHIFARIPPYVVIEAMEDPGSTSDPKWMFQDAPCWAYGPNTTLLVQRGCADFGELSDDADDHIDIELDVESEAFTGTLRLLH